MIIIAAVAYGGYEFVPVAYQAYLFKDLMQHDVDVAATQGYKPSWVGEQLTKSLPEYEIPQDAHHYADATRQSHRGACAVYSPVRVSGIHLSVRV